MDNPDLTCLDRRRVLLAAAGATTLLAGCSTYGQEQGAPAGSSVAPGSAAGSAVRSAAQSAGSAAGSAAAEAAAVAALADVPVGGGKVISGAKLVVTRPEENVVKAFSAVCTHAGCTVGEVSGGTINCPCHGSKFAIADGSVVQGPARSPLAPVQVTVSGDRIVRS